MEKVVWGIHAGREGEAHSLFIKDMVIGIGWPKMGDLSLIDNNRDAFKAAYEIHYPNDKKGAIPVKAGMLYRFVYEMQIGDFIIYPSKFDKKIHIGRITGEYEFNPKSDKNYSNQHPTEWLRSVPRTRFTQGALYEIGSAMTLFQVKNYSDEFMSVVDGSEIDLVAEDDDSIGIQADEIEQTTADFILKRLSRELKGHPFAEFVEHLLNHMGYKTRLSPEGPDGGIDIIAHKDELGFEPPIVKVQVKSKSGNIGDPEVSALYGKVDKNEFGLIVSLSGYSKQAIDFARNKSNLRLIDGVELVNLIYAYYEQLDSRYKGFIPLKRIYIPESIPDGDN